MSNLVAFLIFIIIVGLIFEWFLQKLFDACLPDANDIFHQE